MTGSVEPCVWENRETRDQRSRNVDRKSRMEGHKRVVIKIGSSSITHEETGMLNMVKLEKLVREIVNLRYMGMDVVVVSSGAIAVGRKSLGFSKKPERLDEKQACAAVGQGKLMMMYQKLFSEYDQVSAQVLMTKNTFVNNLSRMNAHNTLMALLAHGAIPIVNENDTVSTYEMQFGDNDTLSAVVTALVEADLLILLSDIDGLFTDDPNQNENATFIDVVEKLDDHLMNMGKSSSGSDVGTGGMATKLAAARIATASGADMIIANGADFSVIHKIMEGEQLGTIFLADKNDDFYLLDYVEKL